MADLDRMRTLDGTCAFLEKEYLDLLLRGKRYEATELIMGAVKIGVNVKDIYLHVFQPAQTEIGRLWQTGKISVAQEHFCTAITQYIIAQLYPYVFTTDKKDKQMVAACVEGELHELGIRMVADFFEMEGWNTYYIGANSPVEGIIETVREYDADLLAISASMTFHLSRVKELISKVKSELPQHKVKIMVGGRPFNLAPEAWKHVNSDCWAPDGQSALEAANQVLIAS